LDVKSADPIAGAVMPALAVAGYMATQAEVIKSERVIARALREQKLDVDPVWQARWKEATSGRGDLLAWQTAQVLRHFEVLPSKEANVITVEYKAPTPESAAAMANAIIKAYVATTVELRSEPAKQYDSFFDGRAQRLREALEKAQSRLSAYQQEAGVVATDERLDVENTRLAELSSQLVTAQAMAGESGSRQQLARGNADQTPEVLASPLIGGLVAELARQEARLDELKTAHGDQHPNVLQARAGIEQVRTRIDTETRKVAASVAVNNSVNVNRVAQMRAALEAQRTRVLRLKSQRDQAGVFQRDVDNASQAYSAAAARVSQANLESNATQTNVSTLKVATPPALPSRPRVFVNTAVSVVLGLLLALVVVVLRESRDQRLRADDDVQVYLQQPLFGVLPDNRAAQAISGQLRRLTLGGPQIAGRLGLNP
jgi:polysaccharide biosynthesis transport protein